MFEIDSPHDPKISRSVRTFVLTAIALSLVAWDISFHLGVYKTIFYSKLFVIWVICTVILMANYCLPNKHRYLDSWGIVAMLSPTLWSVLIFWSLTFGLSGWFSNLIFWVSLLVFSVCLPYGAYIVVCFMQAEAFRLKPRSLIAALAAITVTIGALGFTIGSNHQYFVSCQEFSVAGDSVPENCSPN